MKRLFAPLAVACALFAGACTSSRNDGYAWGQVAAGVGAIIGPSAADAPVAKASARLSDYCGALRAAAFGVDVFASDKIRKATIEARIVVQTLCDAPPADVAAALASAARAYAAIQAAR